MNANAAMPIRPQIGSRNAGTEKRRVSRAVLEARLRPQHGERDEGDDEHDGGGPGEQPARDREVLLADEAVGQRGVGQDGDGGARECGAEGCDAQPAHHEGSTSSIAIWVPAFSSSTSKRPSMVAVKSNSTLPPAVTSFFRS